MRRLLKILFSFIKLSVFLVIFGVLLVSGLAIGGVWLLDYLITGEEVEVPNLYGRTKAEAIEILNERELLLNTKVDDIFSDATPPGTVAQQAPYPGTKVKKRRSVKIGLAARQGPTLIPDLIGTQGTEAQTLLRLANLETGDIQAAVYSSIRGEGAIMAQYPPQGKRELSEKKVNILTSLGSEINAFLMPEYIGLDKEDAFRMLKNSPFLFSENSINYQETSDPYQWNRVLDQRPRPGSKVLEEERITLTLGVSGQESTNYRTVFVRFKRPTVLFPTRLGILVYDESYSTYQSPMIYPVDLDDSNDSIEQWIPILGSATVMLGLVEEVEGMIVPDPIEVQVFDGSRERVKEEEIFIE